MLLNAVMCVWNEEDIIEATVKHLFAQGCSNVFIIDNDSTDNTVKNAVNAGAVLAVKFRTKYFDEDQKVAHLNATVKYINDTMQDDKIWWLYIDADEFPNIEGDVLVKYINMLGDDIGAVHGYHFNHMPTHQPYYVQGYHPADFQPLCIKNSTSKIPLIRYDKRRKHLFSIGGAHDFITHNDIIPIVKDTLHIHHFQYRNPEYTLARSKILAQNRNDWYRKFLQQVDRCDASGYEIRYNSLLKIYHENKNYALKTKSLCYNFKDIIRWYDINEDKQFSSSYYDKSIYSAIYYFFMREYDTALCRFNDAYEVCDDDGTRLWITMKIAECFAFSDIEAANSLVEAMEKSDNTALNKYIDKSFDYIVNAASDRKERIGKIEFYRSVFPDDIESRQNELLREVEKTLFKI
jgi:glycosyltransferase involved in cell wall biosynthesis